MRKLRKKICIWILTAAMVIGGALVGAGLSGGFAEPVYAERSVTSIDSESESEDLVTIEDSETPLSPGVSWAVVNLGLMIVTMAEALIMITEVLVRRKENSPKNYRDPQNRREGEPNRNFIVRILSAPIAFVALVEFMITEDMKAQMVITDMYTVIMIILFTSQTALFVFSRKKQAARAESLGR